MGYKGLVVVLSIISFVHCQTKYKICVQQSDLCATLERDGSEVICHPIQTRVECAIELARGAAHVGYFTEEELLLLGQRQPNEHRVIATVRDVDRQDNSAFEGVVVVPNSHSGGFEGLKGGSYCHPGFGASDIRWSPRVLKTLEALVTRDERCPTDIKDKTAEEVEVATLSSYFSAACRPGPWSWNNTLDADLKRRYPNLCSMCTAPGVCQGYSTEQSVNIAGVSNSNSHIQALDCLITNGSAAFVAWTHVQQFFQNRNPGHAHLYSLLCANGTRVPLSDEFFNSRASPCAVVTQPWGAIVANSAAADGVLAAFKNWMPDGSTSNSLPSWQGVLFNALTPGNAARISFQDTLVTPLQYTSNFRQIPDVESISACLPAQRWCTVSADEQEKCNWIRSAAYSLGIQPTISCQQRQDVFQCLADIKSERADFFSVDSNYGYLARQHYSLSPVKLVQNSHREASRIAVLVNDASNITRFENLRDKVACFPEFGGIAYVAFLRAAHQRGIISASECDYARAVGEFFSGGCAPGALDAAHAISEPSTFNSTSLCNACTSSNITQSFTCAWDETNLYYGNTGALNCLTAPNTDVAAVEIQNLSASMVQMASSFRALCADNSLAATTGVDIPDSCLIAHVVDAEILARRNSPNSNSLNTLLDGLEEFFGYGILPAQQLINLRLFATFNGTSDLLFKDTTIGLTEPSADNSNAAARNYIELFRHLESCTNRATSVTDSTARFVMSFTALIFSALLTRFVVY